MLTMGCAIAVIVAALVALALYPVATMNTDLEGY